jgi:hypothetical protein
MKNLNKTLLLILTQIILLSLNNISAQKSGQEFSYLQTDRNFYIAGESVLYNLFIFDTESKNFSEDSRVGYIMLRSSGSNPVVKVRTTLNSGKGFGKFLIPDSLSSGEYQLVAFTAKMKNASDNAIFKKNIVVVNRYDKDPNFKLSTNEVQKEENTNISDSAFRITTDKRIYAPREKVKLQLFNTLSDASVSISVSESPANFNSTQTLIEVFNKQVTSSDTKSLSKKYLTENKGKILRGRVLDDKTQQPTSQATVLLSCADSVPNLQYSITNNDGLFQFLLTDFYDGKELYFTIKDMPDSANWKIETEDEFSIPNKWNPAQTIDNKDIQDYIFKSQNIVYINKIYKNKSDSTLTLNAESKNRVPEFFNCPAKTILPSDFVALNDFAEITIEILPQIKIGKENGKYKTWIYNDFRNDFFENPAIFLDGVYVDDPGKIAALGTDHIKRIQVLTEERAFGDLVFPGLLSIISKSNEIQKTKPAPQSLRMKNDAPSARVYLSEINSKLISDTTRPILKQTLFWNSNLLVKTNEKSEIEFFTPDNVGNYTIQVDGFTNEGNPITIISNIQVNGSLTK